MTHGPDEIDGEDLAMAMEPSLAGWRPVLEAITDGSGMAAWQLDSPDAHQPAQRLGTPQALELAAR